MRAGISEYIQAQARTKAAFGPLHMPDVILNLHASMVVNSCSPWAVPVENDEWWPQLMSDAQIPPIEVLLEAVWSRLHQRGFVTAHVFGEDLTIEPWHRFLDARFIADAQPHWDYRELLLSQKTINAIAPTMAPIEWKPAFVSQDAHTLASLLTKEIELDLVTLDWPEDALKGAVAELESHGLVGRSLLNPNVIGLITSQVLCMITNKGEFVVGENASGRLVRWLRANGQLDDHGDSVAVLKIADKDGKLTGVTHFLPSDGIGWSEMVRDVFSDPAPDERGNEKKTGPETVCPPPKERNEKTELGS